MKKIKGIMFDKDGTLVNTGNLWFIITRYLISDVFEEFLKNGLKIEEVSEELFEELGITETGMLPNSIAASGTPRDMMKYMLPYTDLNFNELEKAMMAPTYEAVKNLMPTVETFPDVEKALKKLKSQGYILAIGTNDDAASAELMMRFLGLYDYFDIILGSDNSAPKPNPKMGEAFAKKYNFKMDEILYIGDSDVDYEFSKHLGGFIGFGTNINGEINLKTNEMMKIFETKYLK